MLKKKPPVTKGAYLSHYYLKIIAYCCIHEFLTRIFPHTIERTVLLKKMCISLEYVYFQRFDGKHNVLSICRMT